MLVYFLVEGYYNEGGIGLSFGALFYFSLSWVGRFKRNKYLESSDKRVSESEYHYDFFDDCFRLAVYRNGKLRNYGYYDYSDIERYWETKQFYVVAVNSLIYCIRKSELAENSRVPELICRIKEQELSSEGEINRQTIPEDAKTLDKVAFVFLIASVVLPLMALLVPTVVSYYCYLSYAVYGFAFLVCAGVGIASLVISAVLKIKGVTRVRNIVTGIIMTVVSLILAAIFLLA